MIGRPISLRIRLTAGAGLIALVAVFAALLAAYGAAETARRIDQSVSAQRRMDVLSALSARISDYAVVAVEASRSRTFGAAGLARLRSRAGMVADVFARMDTELAGAVAESEEAGEAEQMRRATRSLVLARMKAQFEALRGALEGNEGGQRLRVALDGFATQFSPLLNEAIADERRDRDAAAGGVAELHSLMLMLALCSAAIAIGLAVAFHLVLHRPLIAQVDRVATAAVRIGEGAFDIELPARRRDELGRLFDAINTMTARLRKRREDIDRDRARLNEIIEARTAELSAANSRLCAIDAERRRFFADVGHELRTPLTVILAEAELATKDKIELRAANSALSVIRARARRLDRRIEDMLRVARSDTGQMELDSRLFDLAKAAEDAVGDMAPLIKRRRVSLAKSFEETPIVGDADWCRQVIGGLIENAVRHSPAEGAIELATAAENGEAVLTVTDEGDGLEPEDRELVFDRFARGAREENGSGFGVGLSLARWVIERHGGSIALHSPTPRPPEGGRSGGRGAQVEIRLPLDAGAGTQRQTRKAGHG